MNERQLDMIIGYLNEGIEIDKFDLFYESLQEEFKRFEFINENIEIINEGEIIDKIKEIFKKVIEFIRKIKRFIAGKIRILLIKFQKQIIKLKSKNNVNEAVELKTIEYPYYLAELENGEEVKVSIGNLSLVEKKSRGDINHSMNQIFILISNFKYNENQIKEFEDKLLSIEKANLSIKYESREVKNIDETKLEIAEKIVKDLQYQYKINEDYDNFEKRLNKNLANLKENMTDENYKIASRLSNALIKGLKSDLNNMNVLFTEMQRLSASLIQSVNLKN